MLTSKIISPRDRTQFYLTVYACLLLFIGILGCCAPILLVLYTNKSEFSFWVLHRFWWLTGIGAIVAGHFILWSFFDRRTKPNTSNVYHNPFHRPKCAIEYQEGFNVGNPFEKRVDGISAVIGKKKIPEDKPLDGTALDDILQIWGTLTVQSVGAEFFNLGKTRDEALAVALELAEDRISSVIESFTVVLFSKQILGNGLWLTDRVNEVCHNDPAFLSRGFTVYWETGKMDESEAVKAAKKARRENSIFAEAVRDLASEPGPDGTYPIGAISNEDAAAIYLAREGYGEYGKNSKEMVIRVTGDPNVIEFLKGQGLLVGTVSEHLHDATIHHNDNQG